MAARALVIGERIDTRPLQRREVISAAPLAYRQGSGIVIVFRYGVLVMIGLSAAAEAETLAAVLPHVQGRLATPIAEAVDVAVEAAQPAGLEVDEHTIQIGPISPEKLLVLGDALAKSAALTHDEGQVSEVFDTVEPWARKLESGRVPGPRRSMVRQIGAALLVQHRLADRVAVREKPDTLWDRPDLERLYGQLEDYYELVERAQTLEHKLDLIGETVTVMTDLIDTQRSLRLEAIVVALIAFEIILTGYQILNHIGG